ncbi:MAG TPA: exodeoxyribonuclease VII large subunit [Nitrospira sp.]|nr:exodeoxyribonuclease VII large subunit [Nitrospira sp.]
MTGPGSDLVKTTLPRQIFTVTQLTAFIRTALETDFADVWIEGEISNLRAPGSGHVYFSLKDKASQIRAVLFRSAAIRLLFGLREGMHIVARGRLTVYEPRGEYQIVLETMEPKGVGALQVAFEQLKGRLAKEGLFDSAKKRSLPLFPKSVGIVTSLSGAAIRDMLSVLHRRWPLLHVVIAPVPVQGEGAGHQIAAGVQCLNEDGRVDVIIVGRGGGSQEDLWSFNEEVVVRAVAESRIPVVSAVGHEIDVTLTDFAADVRAPTPSAAAEIVVPVLSETVARLRSLTMRAAQIVSRHCRSEQRRLEASRLKLRHVRFRLQLEAQRADEVVARLTDGLSSSLLAHKRSLDRINGTLIEHSPLDKINRGLVVIPLLVERLHHQIRAVTSHRRHQVQSAIAQLHNLSPLSVLGRGYAIVTIGAGTVVKKIGDISSGDEVRTRIVDGQFDCLVRRVVPDGSV